MKNWLVNLFKTYFVGYFPYVVVFLASLYNSADSDLGWHLKYGEYFFKNFSILRENIFSTEMAGYRWVNSSWATDILSYITFNWMGFMGLTILGGLVVTAIFFFFAKAAKLSFWEKAFIFPLILYLEEPLTVVSFRGHLLSLLAISILYYLFKLFEEGNKKSLFLIPLLFMLWSNFHGEFILGLGLLLGFIVFYIIRVFLLSSRAKSRDLLTRSSSHLREIPLRQLADRNDKCVSLVKVFIGSFLATLVNPFFISTYIESLRHFGNPFQKYIIEWLPFDTKSSLWWTFIVWGIVILLSLIILKIKKQLVSNLPYVGLLLILYGFSFWMRRYAWPMYFISIPVVVHFFRLLTPRDKKITYFLPSLTFILFYFFVTFIKFPSQRFQTMNWERYCKQYVNCSPESAEFLKKQKLKGDLLSFYNWGGFLIWNYPEIKPSIDGRMHLWRDEKGYSAFADYYPLEQNWKEVDKSKYDIVYMPPFKPIHKQMMKLVEEKKWKIVYQDEYATIFVRSGKKVTS
ncbi:hypothetical protein HY945_02040 [Candidatus Gottesmanbacteria bacterium]|nr:hypothetical protein [Candidatus Gottesmanbacteria bacterium]